MTTESPLALSTHLFNLSSCCWPPGSLHSQFKASSSARGPGSAWNRQLADSPPRAGAQAGPPQLHHPLVEGPRYKHSCPGLPVAGAVVRAETVTDRNTNTVTLSRNQSSKNSYPKIPKSMHKAGGTGHPPYWEKRDLRKPQSQSPVPRTDGRMGSREPETLGGQRVTEGGERPRVSQDTVLQLRGVWCHEQ